jgi:hypothetical protein
MLRPIPAAPRLSSEGGAGRNRPPMRAPAPTDTNFLQLLCAFESPLKGITRRTRRKR